MRIILDTDSKGWQQFKRVSLGILIILVALIVFGIIEKYTGLDGGFISGYIYASMVYLYPWKNEKD